MRGMRFFRRIARRTAVLAALVLLVSMAVFALLQATPGDSARILLGNRPATSETLADIRAQHNLDDPLPVQYLAWLGGVVRGDLGESIRTQQPVRDVVLERLSLSGQLALYAFVLTLAFGVPLGLWAALRRGRLADRAISGFSVVSAAAPAFVSGLLLVALFSVQLGWFDPFGAGEAGWDRVRHLTLPAIALALSVVALIVKLTRTAVLEVLDQDYVTFARARGLSRRRVLTAYVLRNALIPVVTAAGLVLGYLITGAVLVEVTFDLSGVGSLLVASVSAKDIPVVQGITVVLALVIIAINLATDALYALVDPRIRHAGGRS